MLFFGAINENWMVFVLVQVHFGSRKVLSRLMESSVETHTGTHELGVVRRDLRSVWVWVAEKSSN